MDIQKILRKSKINEQIQDKTVISLISGKTGSGKTYSMLEEAVKYLKEEIKGGLVISMHSREAAYVIYSMIQEKVETQKNPKLILYISGSIPKNRPLCLSKKEETYPKVIITTHAYLNTRGDSDFSYPLILDIF